MHNDHHPNDKPNIMNKFSPSLWYVHHGSWFLGFEEARIGILKPGSPHIHDGLAPPPTEFSFFLVPAPPVAEVCYRASNEQCQAHSWLLSPSAVLVRLGLSPISPIGLLRPFPAKSAAQDWAAHPEDCHSML